MKLNYFKESLMFKFPAGTSRGVLLNKPSWVFHLEDEPTVRGECSIIPGLSPDYQSEEEYEQKIRWVCETFNKLIKSENQQRILSFFCEELKSFPSILFGIETLIFNFNLDKGENPFKSPFSEGSEGILINGLVWMGSEDYILKQLKEKVKIGYTVLKLKIGAMDWGVELDILKSIRSQYGDQVEIRVDANGAFDQGRVRDVLKSLKELQIHSIEQPIEKGNVPLMKALCEEEILPIALDEELIGVHDLDVKRRLLQDIGPQYIILKPSLHGGIIGCNEWVELAEAMDIGWWITSALESNIGLEMIARFAASFDLVLAQGLGTGGLFHNNFQSELVIKEGHLFLSNEKK
jgi:O-succinylbenzoate synthase